MNILETEIWGYNMYQFYRLVFGILFIFLLVNSPTFAQSVPVSQLTTIETAEPIGKGGSITAFSFFQYTTNRVNPDQKQGVEIGGFEEMRYISLEIDTYLLPVRFTYGLSEQLDLNLGATVSIGDVHKVVHNFYDTQDTELVSDRVYDQPVYDGMIGLKYNLKPERNDGFPSISVGGNFYSGFSADDRLNSDNEFLDQSPIDGYPYVGMNAYCVGTQRLRKYFKVHAGIGVYLSSKSLRTTDSFALNWQLGGEIAIADNMWFAADYANVIHHAGIHISNTAGLAFRYQTSNSLAFQIGLSNQPGFYFSLTLGGEKAQEVEGNKLLF